MEELNEQEKLPVAQDQKPSIAEIESATDEKKACFNCNTELAGIYCSNCGQKDIPKRQTLGELLTNFISSFWSYESKFFKTWNYLLFKPGLLPEDYNNGKRERYFHPARMYVFISFVYFLLLASLPDKAEDDGFVITTGRDMEKEDQEGDEDKDSFSAQIFSDDSIVYESRRQYDSIQETLAEDKRDNWIMRKLQYRQIEIDQKYKNRRDDFSKDIKAAFLNNFPKVFFWLLPIFALILKLLYIRRDFYYSEHLVFSIYYYNFFFLAGSIYMLLNLIPILNWFTTFLGIWIAVYFLLAMKKMYKQRWSKTILKYFAFGACFLICVSLGMVINLFTILMFI